MAPAERRYSDAEVARILERATAHVDGATTAPVDGDGLTLAQLQDIGREIGVPPAVIAQSAAIVDLPHGTVTRRVAGMPLAVEHVVPLPRRLTDDEWERLVVDLRDTFDARGVTRQDGSLRQWANGNLQALQEPDGTGFRLRLRTRKGNTPGLMAGGAVSCLVGGLGYAGVVATTDVGAMWATGVLAIGGLGTLLGAALALGPWARRRQQQMAGVAARLVGRLDAG